MELIVVRHGETDADKNGFIIGNTDVDLNETGKLQAENIRKAQLRGIDYNLIFSSPLLRAIKTARVINRGKGQEIIEDDRLKERDYGLLEGITNNDPIITKCCNYSLNLACEGGERVQEFFDRVWSFLDDIKKNYPDKTIVVVTHQGVCRAINYYFKGIPLTSDLSTIFHEPGKIKRYSTIKKY